jgi:hypothetical protein
VWRPGEGISRTVESDAPTPAATARPTPPRPSAPPEPETVQADARRPEAARSGAAKPDAGKRRARTDPAERGLRELVGAGSSQLGPVRAMRARDLNRPTDADLAQAEEDVVLVRRHWQPPAGG